MFGRALAAAGAVLLLGGLSVASAQDVRKAKLGHSFADSHPRAVAMKQFAASVAKATQGKVVIDVYGSAVLGSEGPRDAKPDGAGQLQCDGHERGTDGLHGGLPRARDQALDGYEHPVVDMYANKMFEVQKYLTITNHVYTPVALLASKTWWTSLTPEQQTAVQKVAEETRAFERAEELRQAADVVTQLKAKGMPVTEMPPAELEKIRNAVQPVIDKNAETIGKDFVQTVYGELQKFRAARR